MTYTDSIVETKPPNTLKSLYRQRALSWETSVPELFMLNIKLLLHPKAHYLLKTEKASQLYIFLTDPLRILLIWLLFTKPSRALVMYAFYLFITILVWIKTKRQDPFWVVLAFPFYSLFITLCRFVGYFQWFRLKINYIFNKKYHRVVTRRRMVFEYAVVSVVIIALWTVSFYRFNADIQVLRHIQSSRLDSYNGAELENEGATEIGVHDNHHEQMTSYTISVAPNDTSVTLAYKAVERYELINPVLTVPDEKRYKIAEGLQSYIGTLSRNRETVSLQIDAALIDRAVRSGLSI